MRYAVLSLAALTMTWLVAAGDEPKRVLTDRDAADNIEVRLMAAWVDKTRGQFLHATFVTVKGEPEELRVRFPGHSHTTHETSLMNVVYSATAPRQQLGHDRKEAFLDVVFSIPKDFRRHENDFSRWYVVSIKVRDKQ